MVCECLGLNIHKKVIIVQAKSGDNVICIGSSLVGSPFKKRSPWDCDYITNEMFIYDLGLELTRNMMDEDDLLLTNEIIENIIGSEICCIIIF